MMMQMQRMKKTTNKKMNSEVKEVERKTIEKRMKRTTTMMMILRTTTMILITQVPWKRMT